MRGKGWDQTAAYITRSSRAGQRQWLRNLPNIKALRAARPARSVSLSRLGCICRVWRFSGPILAATSVLASSHEEGEVFSIVDRRRGGGLLAAGADAERGGTGRAARAVVAAIRIHPHTGRARAVSRGRAGADSAQDCGGGLLAQLQVDAGHGIEKELGGEAQAIEALKALGDAYERRMRVAEDEAPKMIRRRSTGKA